MDFTVIQPRNLSTIQLSALSAKHVAGGPQCKPPWKQQSAVCAVPLRRLKFCTLGFFFSFLFTEESTGLSSTYLNHLNYSEVVFG